MLRGGIAAQTLGDELVLLDLGSEQYFGLNAVGAFLWPYFQRGSSLDEATAAVLEEYDVTPEAARRDVLTFIEQLRAAGLLAAL